MIYSLISYSLVLRSDDVRLACLYYFVFPTRRATKKTRAYFGSLVSLYSVGSCLTLKKCVSTMNSSELWFFDAERQGVVTRQVSLRHLLNVCLSAYM